MNRKQEIRTLKSTILLSLQLNPSYQLWKFPRELCIKKIVSYAKPSLVDKETKGMIYPPPPRLHYPIFTLY